MEKFDESEGRWVTINGQRIFIKKGENFRSAYKRKIGEKTENKKSLRQIIEERKNKQNPVQNRTEEKSVNEKSTSETRSPSGNTPERRKKILIKAYEAEEKKLREDIGKIMRRDDNSEMDYEGRKIKIHSNRDLTDAEEDKLDRLHERLRDVEHQLTKLRR